MRADAVHKVLLGRRQSSRSTTCDVSRLNMGLSLSRYGQDKEKKSRVNRYRGFASNVCKAIARSRSFDTLERAQWWKTCCDCVTPNQERMSPAVAHEWT